MNAAAFSEHLGTPRNSVISINAEHLQRIGRGGVFADRHLWEGFSGLKELMRKLFEWRGVPFIAIWSREGPSEQATHPGEHWHIGVHLPPEHREDFASQMRLWTGEEIDTERPPSPDRVAVSVDDGWLISKRNGGCGPEGIAIYLGKAEPSEMRLHGRMKSNLQEPHRWRHGGTGPVEGQRFGVSRTLDCAAQDGAGFSQPHVAPFDDFSNDERPRNQHRPGRSPWKAARGSLEYERL